MKNIKKLIIVGAMVVAVGAASVTAYAASSYRSPEEALAGLTGRTVEDVTAERYETGKTYGMMASEAGKLDAFKAEMLQIQKDTLAKKVKAGLITQERADAIIASPEGYRDGCHGADSSGYGGMMSGGYGNGYGSMMNGGYAGGYGGMMGSGYDGI